MRWLVAFFLLMLAVPAWADEARPLYVEGQAGEQGEVTFTWRIPPNFSSALAPDMRLPADCEATSALREWSDSLGHWREAHWQCAQPIPARAFSVDYPNGNPNLATIFKAVQPDGSSTIAMSLPGKVRHLFPDGAVASESGSMWDYLVLGIEHIWLGIDHLLFVACLIWIAGTPRRILATVTGFTLAHSVTLALAALDFVSVPVKTVEVLIALSIVLLAVELARGRRETVTWRYPVAVSTGFGLLHGFGFAAVLGEIGLPQDGLIGALFAFNIGIEIGQLLFVLALASATWALDRAMRMAHAHEAQWSVARALVAGPQMLVAYAVGITATYWMLERAL